MRILDHDDRGIDHGANRDRDPAERHNVGVQPLLTHDDERDQNRDREGQNHDESRANVEEKYHANERDDETFLDQFLAQRLDRSFDQGRAVGDGHDLDALGKSLLQFLKLCLDALDDVIGVGAISYDDDPADDLAVTVQLRETATHVGPPLHRANVLQQDRRAVAIHTERDLLEVRDLLDNSPHLES